MINSSAAPTTTLLGLVPGLVMSQLLHQTHPKMQMSRRHARAHEHTHSHTHSWHKTITNVPPYWRSPTSGQTPCAGRTRPRWLRLHAPHASASLMFLPACLPACLVFPSCHRISVSVSVCAYACVRVCVCIRVSGCVSFSNCACSVCLGVCADEQAP